MSWGFGATARRSGPSLARPDGSLSLQSTRAAWHAPCNRVVISDSTPVATTNGGGNVSLSRADAGLSPLRPPFVLSGAAVSGAQDGLQDGLHKGDRATPSPAADYATSKSAQTGA